ncbi:MAG: cell division protein ZapE [Gammaproteobacteria bacterium]|nr:cell division protein ZapE [Gammaproteobacteria bacterium]NKB63987.1 cell division protein ZapE [Gammaproteobacteria bacterium]
MEKQSPLVIYNHHLKGKALIEDTSQAAAIGRLDRIYWEVQERKRSGTGIFNRLFKSKPPPIRGLYLWGGVGTGKTLLMDIFFEALGSDICRRVHFHRFMQNVHELKTGVKDQQNPLKIVARHFSKQHPVLCLDEFAVTDITDAMILSGLLGHLFEQGVVLITTSNIEIKNLYLHGLQRDRFQSAIQLLLENTQQINVDSGQDYRQRYLLQDDIYHCPLGPEADQAMDAAFKQLSGLYGENGKEITLCGRSVEIIGTGSGVIWFEFESLCQTNRSKMDYIELSKRFHTILLGNIPILDKKMDDPTRRLIELIDELYDRGVNLIVSAAEKPEKLYVGNRLAIPFKRTVSRLQEMSSPEYLSKPHLQ